MDMLRRGGIRRRAALALLLAAVFVLSRPDGRGATAGAAEPLETLIARVLRAYGGEALPRVGQPIRMTGRSWSVRRGVSGVVRRELIWPDRLEVEIAYADGAREHRVLAGSRGWHDGRPAPPPLVAAMRLQAARLALPMLLDWERHRLTDLGEALAEEGARVRRVEVDLGDGLRLVVEIDAASARIRRSAGVMVMAGAEMAFVTRYGGFRNFGGVTWPTREEQSAMGRETGWTVIEALDFGPTEGATQ